jgi:Fic family protein
MPLPENNIQRRYNISSPIFHIMPSVKELRVLIKEWIRLSILDVE